MSARKGSPRHGVGALGHGYVDGACGDYCNNGQCRAGLNHDRCTLECSALVVWDDIGCWAPDAPHLKASQAEETR